MFKILHTADSHFQQNRLDECVANAGFISEYAIEHEPDLIIHAGDLFHKNTVINSKEYLAAIDFITNMSYIAPVIIIRGNHDPEGCLGVLGKMENVFTFDDLSILEYNDIVEYPYSIELCLIPYQKTTSLSGDTVNKAHVSIAKELKKYISKFAKNKIDSQLKLVVAHVSIAGAELANSERMLGNEVMLSPNDFLKDGVHGVMLGHIHRNDQDILDGAPMAYSGSHYRTRFDEIMEPGFCFWSFDMEDGEWFLADKKFVRTPARDMVKWELTTEETKEYMSTGEFPFELLPNTDMKVIFSVPEGMVSKLDKEKFKEVLDLKKHNSTVKVSTIVEPTGSVRSVNIAKMKTKTDIFQEWADVSKIKMTKTVKEKFSELIEQFDD